MPWCLCTVPWCRGSAVTDQTRLGKTGADAAMRAFPVFLYLYLHETQICSENCASCPIMRSILALSATKRNLVAGIACRGRTFGEDLGGGTSFLGGHSLRILPRSATLWLELRVVSGKQDKAG